MIELYETFKEKEKQRNKEQIKKDLLFKFSIFVRRICLLLIIDAGYNIFYTATTFLGQFIGSVLGLGFLVWIIFSRPIKRK